MTKYRFLARYDQETSSWLNRFSNMATVPATVCNPDVFFINEYEYTCLSENNKADQSERNKNDSFVLIN